jgi:hypothetical protein
LILYILRGTSRPLGRNQMMFLPNRRKISRKGEKSAKKKMWNSRPWLSMWGAFHVPKNAGWARPTNSLAQSASFKQNLVEKTRNSDSVACAAIAKDLRVAMSPVGGG